MTTRMSIEIAEQPAAVARTVSAMMAGAGELRTALAGCSRVYFAARGTSDNAAEYGRYLLQARCGVLASGLAPSVATHYRTPVDFTGSAVVSISQSGATEEIVAAQRWAAAGGARTIAIVNEADSPLAAEADIALIGQAGPELAVPATKSYLAQLVGVAVLASALDPRGEEIAEQLAAAPAALTALIADDRGLAAGVELLAASPRAVVTSRGILLGTALETGLKLEETCRRPVRGSSYADLRHGPIAAVGEGTAAIVVAAPDGPMLSAMGELAEQLAERGARVIAIGGDARLAEAAEVALPGGSLPEWTAPITSVVPGQRLAEGLAQRLGLDPDQPPGLAKVTWTDQN